MISPDIKSFVEEYRNIFYDSWKNKIIPYIILNAEMSIKEAFLGGYYMADGFRKDTELIGCKRADIKSKISAMNLFYFLRIHRRH